MSSKFFSRILDFIYPTKCTFCNEMFIRREDYICPNCRENLKVEGKIIPIFLSDGKPIECISIFEYSGDAKDAVLRFKFKGYKHYSAFFSKIIADEIKKKFPKISFDLVSFVPLKGERQRKRGYNQSECIASGVSENIGIPCKELLVKIKSNHVQHELDLSSRIENVRGVYAVKNGANVKGKTILLCDDIVTSGSTLAECVKTLFKAGAKEVYCATVLYSRYSFLSKHQ